MNLLARGLLCVLLLILTGCEGDKRTPSHALQDQQLSTNPPVIPFALPIRRSAEVISFSAPAPAETQRLDDVLVRSSQVDEDVQLVVHGGGTQELSGCAWLTERLNFASSGAGPLRRRVSKNDRKAFGSELTRLLSEAERRLEQTHQRIALADQPGLLPGDPLAAGRLVYTGHPLDLAMPDAGQAAVFFLPVRAAGGEVVYTRGGRLFVNDDGRLALQEGVILEPFVIPAETRAVRVRPRGEVEVVLEDGSSKILGNLALVPLRNPRGDGRVFTGTAGEGVHAGDLGVGLLKPGHLEFPRVDLSAERARLALCDRDVRLLQRIELGLAEPFRQTLVNIPNLPVQPVENPQPDHPQNFPLVIAADIPLAAAHLKALGFQVELAPGRAVIPTGDGEESRSQLVNGLTKVLQGLRKRMDIAQVNYRNANRLRDEQGQLNPYRRKLIRVGPEGELLEAEDETPFRKELNPNHPDAGPDGTVLFPNVNRMVEKADFEQAASEYRLIRAAVERLAPNIIFSDPPVLQVQTEAKAP